MDIGEREHPPKKERRGKEKIRLTTYHVLNEKLPLDTRPIRRKIWPLLVLGVDSSSTGRRARLLRYGGHEKLPHHQVRASAPHPRAR